MQTIEDRIAELERRYESHIHHIVHQDHTGLPVEPEPDRPPIEIPIDLARDLLSKLEYSEPETQVLISMLRDYDKANSDA